MQTARLETGAIVPVDDEYCVNCGCSESTYESVENQLYCEECVTLARANQVVHEGLNAIVETLVDKIPQCDWTDLGWRISIGFGGKPQPNGINWHCEEID